MVFQAVHFIEDFVVSYIYHFYLRARSGVAFAQQTCFLSALAISLMLSNLLS